MAQAAALLSERLVGVRGYLGWVLFFAVLGTAMAVVGPILVIKQWMERFAVWVVLLTLTWIMRLTRPLFFAFGHAVSGRDLILILGGLFLIWKSTGEIHQSLEGREGEASGAVKATFGAVILQIKGGKFVYVTSEVANLVHVIDVATTKVTHNIKVGKRPRRFAFSADGSELWVTSELASSVSIIGTKDLNVVATLPFEDIPQGTLGVT